MGHYNSKVHINCCMETNLMFTIFEFFNAYAMLMSPIRSLTNWFHAQESVCFLGMLPLTKAIAILNSLVQKFIFLDMLLSKKMFSFFKYCRQIWSTFIFKSRESFWKVSQSRKFFISPFCLTNSITHFLSYFNIIYIP